MTTLMLEKEPLALQVDFSSHHFVVALSEAKTNPQITFAQACNLLLQFNHGALNKPR